MNVKAYAKLNLTLDVLGRQDGYHMLDSLVCTVDMFDLIKLRKRKDNHIFIEMHGRGTEILDYDDNNAVKAAQAFIDFFGTGGVDITIYKNIPQGAGLGGSSADISGVIRGMAQLYGIGGERDLKDLADSLGSDTGYMLTGGFARLTGRGERVERLDIKAKLYFLLLVPKDGVSTAECYRLCDVIPCGKVTTENALKMLYSGDITGLGANLGNALYAPAVKLNPDVKTAFEELEAFSPLGVNMTGSGSGVFALFENAEYCAWARSRYRGKLECIQLKTV